MSWCRHDPFLVYLDNNLKPDLIRPIQRDRDLSFKENCEETIVTLSKCLCPHSYTSKHYLFVSQMCSRKSSIVFHKIWYDIFMYACDMNLIEFICLYWCIHLGVYIYIFVIIHIYNMTYIYMIIWFHIYIYTPRTTQPLSALFRKAAPAVSSNFGSLEDLKRRAFQRGKWVAPKEGARSNQLNQLFLIDCITNQPTKPSNQPI